MSIPTLIIGGYLGAGKTSLVNQMLRSANGLRIAVLVNDFGDLNIDADLIQGQDGDLLSLAGGCVCCSFGSDLVAALMQMAARQPRVDLVLIETSGVAVPGAVARSVRLVAGLRLQAIVGLLDAETCQARSQDRYVGDLILQQLHEADVLLLNKVDLVSEAALAACLQWLASVRPTAWVWPCQQADFSLEFLLEAARPIPDPVADPAADALATLDHWGGGERYRVPGAGHEAAFESAAWTLSAAQDPQQLCRTLEGQPSIVRAKGYFKDAAGRQWLLHKVGQRCELRESSLALGSDAVAGRLVVIALRGQRPQLMLA
ncbi:GTP-binding protein [Hydrogenophaga sp.]|uniref:CobW family GTP-binding protein n=1 Tax=Hydrogenophaga sp. TaxID=1904254 RepID=UPI00286EA481|nr:GTP-binding protein [Hydrogenophaga sp.]